MTDWLSEIEARLKAATEGAWPDKLALTTNAPTDISRLLSALKLATSALTLYTHVVLPPHDGTVARETLEKIKRGEVSEEGEK